MSDPANHPEPRRGGVRPLGALEEAWALLRDTKSYWLILGMGLVAALGNSVPFQILYWPLVAGVHLAVIALIDRGEARFGMIGEGFQSFTRFVPLIVVGVITGLILIALYMFGALLWLMPEIVEAAEHDRPPDITVFVVFYGIMGVMGLLSLAVYLATMFAAPLVMDYDIDGWSAIKLSARAVRMNALPLAGWMIVCILCFGLGYCLCCLPSIAFIPIYFASHTLIYRQIFPSTAIAETF
jgi:hypothetical protein